ncbi:MAG: hypothetical protein IH630_06850 [Thermoplasmata archaeon]|nr:hypothetical protein [Thermoplasmata archaeon]
MPPEERTRKASRKRMVIELRVDIDYEQLQQGRAEPAISEDRWKAAGRLPKRPSVAQRDSDG